MRRRKKKMENKCEKLNMQHAWENIENNMVYATYPPTYPNLQKRCINCGKVMELQTIQREIKEWKEVAPL